MEQLNSLPWHWAEPSDEWPSVISRYHAIHLVTGNKTALIWDLNWLDSMLIDCDWRKPCSAFLPSQIRSKERVYPQALLQGGKREVDVK